MILYHTSDREIRMPDIHRGRKNADFSPGFYLTPDREFARRWAGTNAVVNTYDLDTKDLSIHTFRRDADWFLYIFRNRSTQDRLTADAVIGPIANDTLFDTLGIISSGYLNPEDALSLLMIGPEYTQVAVKTEKAAKQLRWIRSEPIERPDAAEREAEQAAYLEQLAPALEAILGAEAE